LHSNAPSKQLPEQVTLPDDVCELVMGPVEHRNAVVVDEVQKPAEPMSKFGKKQLRHAYDSGERWIGVLKYLPKYLIIARQRVFQLHLANTASHATYYNIGYCTHSKAIIDIRLRPRF